ncbi:hypothetical protein CRUP_014128 [Coryphaenoides rupestris]|nr:hypothetical protein CRUP_014128 [Coryphaenoides rupestris]
MASAGVVGQNQGPPPPQARLDSDPQLLLFKFVNVRKKTPRKTSLEKMMMFRKCSGTGGEVGSATPDRGGRASVHHHHQHHHPGSTSAPVAGDAAGLPGEGRAADAPRSADGGHGDSSSGGAPGSVMMKTTAPVPGSRDSQRGPAASDHPRNKNETRDRDSNQNTRGHRRHAHETAHEVASVPPARASTAHVGARGARSNPSALHGAPDAEAGGGARLPLERLTQGRTGVVRLARAEPPRRRKAWSIFAPDGRVGAGDPRVKAERGEGHRFTSRTVTQDWCDACNCQIAARAALKCQKVVLVVVLFQHRKVNALQNGSTASSSWDHRDFTSNPTTVSLNLSVSLIVCAERL